MIKKTKKKKKNDLKLDCGNGHLTVEIGYISLMWTITMSHNNS
jgi:hypothetical protein